MYYSQAGHSRELVSSPFNNQFDEIEKLLIESRPRSKGYQRFSVNKPSFQPAHMPMMSPMAMNHNNTGFISAPSSINSTISVQKPSSVSSSSVKSSISSPSLDTTNLSPFFDPFTNNKFDLKNLSLTSTNDDLNFNDKNVGYLKIWGNDMSVWG